MDKNMLTGTGEQKGRASHSTQFSLLVEQGIPGVIFYLLYLAWITNQILKLRNRIAKNYLLQVITPATLAILVSVTIGDIFVDYLKSEVRFWFISIMIVLTALNLTKETSNGTKTKKTFR